MSGKLAYIAVALVSCVAVPAAGRTWLVAQDGSGDFSVIQDAVDAASDGDVIEIGTGRYEDYQTIDDGTVTWDIHVFLPEGVSLTLRGAGAGQTVIGPPDPLEHDNPTYGIATGGSNHVVVTDLSIENCNHGGIYQAAGSVIVERCSILVEHESHMAYGISGGMSEGGLIRGCIFEGFDRGVRTIYSAGAVVEIDDCEFVDCRTGVYAYTSGSSSVHISGSRFDCEVGGIAFLDFAGGSVANCQFTNCALSLSGSGSVTITDSAVIRDDGLKALVLNNFEPVVIQRNVFESNGIVVDCRSLGLGLIRDNYFIRTGDEYWIYGPDNVNNNGIEIDFSLNYWGTTDVAEIAAGIWDCQDDPSSYNCVLFEPVADAPVRVESNTWSAVKSLFR